MRASKTWEKEYKEPKDKVKEFTKGDNNKELELDIF
jgi:hypothetical protein